MLSNKEEKKGKEKNKEIQLSPTEVVKSQIPRQDWHQFLSRRYRNCTDQWFAMSHRAPVPCKYSVLVSSHTTRQVFCPRLGQNAVCKAGCRKLRVKMDFLQIKKTYLGEDLWVLMCLYNYSLEAGVKQLKQDEVKMSGTSER